MVPPIANPTFKLPRELPLPVAFFHPGSGPGTDTTSLSSNLGGDRYPTPLSRLSIWAYLALAFVILTLVAVISYMIYTCYYTAGLRVRLKTGTAAGVAADADGVKGGWQNLEDPSGETVVERGEGRLTKGRDVGEKVDVDYRDEHKTDGVIHLWSERSRSGLKGLGIQLERKPQFDFTSQPNESQTSILPGSPHSTCSLDSTSDHEHEQDLESSEGSDCPSMSAEPLAHTTERSATYLPSNVPLPLPLPLPLPVTPPAQEQHVRQKRTRLRALTQILAYNLMQNQSGRETYFELQPMIKQAENGVDSQSKALLSKTPDESSPPSPPLSSSQFAFFAPYPNCNSISTSNIDSNATFTSNSWGNNSSGSPTAASTPITPLTPITPMTPVTPMKPGPIGASAAELRFDSNNIQFIETPARNSDASSDVGASPPEVRGALGAALTRAGMWNDPKLSPVLGVPPGLDEEKTGLAKKVNPTEIVVAKTRAAGASKLKSPTTSVWQTRGGTFDSSLPGHVPAPTLATPDQVLHGHANLRLGHLRRGVSLSSPPSPSPSRYSDDSSPNSVTSSPSITTVKFILDRGELKRDNLRNRDRVGLGKEKKENMKALSPIPRPVFVPHAQPSKFSSEQPF